MSVTLAVAAVRLAQLDTLVQQMAATESLAAVDTICVDKTGTLTTGELELVGRRGRRRRAPRGGPARPWRASPPAPASATAPSRRSPTRYPGDAPSGSRPRCPFSSEWKWSGLTLTGRAPARPTCSAPPTCSSARGALELPPRPAAERSSSTPRAGRRVVAFGRAPGALPADPAAEPPPPVTPLALVVLEETLRPDAAETIEFMREQKMDLKLISGDARADRDRGRARPSASPPTPA